MLDLNLIKMIFESAKLSIDLAAHTETTDFNSNCLIRHPFMAFIDIGKAIFCYRTFVHTKHPEVYEFIFSNCVAISKFHAGEQFSYLVNSMVQSVCLENRCSKSIKIGG